MDRPHMLNGRSDFLAGSMRMVSAPGMSPPLSAPPLAISSTSISSPRMMTPRRLSTSQSYTGPALSGYAQCPSIISTNAGIPCLPGRGSIRAASVPRQLQTVEDQVAKQRLLEPPIYLYKDTLDCFLRSMQSEIEELRSTVYDERESRNPRKWSIHAERDARKAVDRKLDHLGKSLELFKKQFVNPQSLPDRDLRKALDKIEARGNIHVDISSNQGHVQLIRPLLFQRRTAGDPPTAEWAQPELAQKICEDLAEVAKVFDCPVMVEGHTKGGEGEFWQALANSRARLVAEKLVRLDVPAEKISCQGLPGKLGVNNSCTVVRLDLPSLAHQPVQSWPQALAVEPQLSFVGTVVENGPFVSSGISGTQSVPLPAGTFNNSSVPVFVEQMQLQPPMLVDNMAGPPPRMFLDSRASSAAVSRSVSAAAMPREVMSPRLAQCNAIRSL